MPIISIKVPQLGEGLREALVVEFLKKPGDKVARDEPIYILETDKVTSEIESAHEGILVKWEVEAGTVLEVGSEIGRIEIQYNRAFESDRAGNKTPPQKILVPPKTRKYLKELNLIHLIDRIPVNGSKLMPSDVDEYIKARSLSIGGTSDNYSIEPLTKSQIKLNYRLSQSAKNCVTATIMTDINWRKIEAVQEKNGENRATKFAMTCWVIVQALKIHPKFRSSLAVDGRSLKVFRGVNLGVAVALPNGDVVTALIKDAETMSYHQFIQNYAKQVKKARNGCDQADDSITLNVSNIGAEGMKYGIPVIMHPAIATLSIGKSYPQPVQDGGSWKFELRVSAVLSFDHRVVNGAEASRFLNDIKRFAEAFKQ